jgi:hypothetical protein
LITIWLSRITLPSRSSLAPITCHDNKQSCLYHSMLECTLNQRLKINNFIAGHWWWYYLMMKNKERIRTGTKWVQVGDLQKSAQG